MSYTEWTKEKTQYGMKKEVDKANEMVKQVATEKEKKKAKVCLVYGVLDRRWWAKYDVVSAPPHRKKQLSDTRLFFCS
jgi:hypothetical protein